MSHDSHSDAGVNLLAVSIGNTRTAAGCYIDGQCVARHVVLNDELETAMPAVLTELAGSLRDLEFAPAVLASVKPALDQTVTQLLQAAGFEKVLRIERDLAVPVGRQVDAGTIVGDDRLLNAAAAYDVLHQACVVVDAGTAITVDFIDGAGTFHGGAIGPGAQLMLDSLRQETAQLPAVQFAAPDEPIGHSTSQAMRSAVFHGLRGMVRELVEQYAEVAGAYPMVIATGGDATALFEHYELVERIVPDLTLRGLAVSLRATMRAAENE
jgi:type III pantothenate kinase